MLSRPNIAGLLFCYLPPIVVFPAHRCIHCIKWNDARSYQCQNRIHSQIEAYVSRFDIIDERPRDWFPAHRCIFRDDEASFEHLVRIALKVEAYVSLCNAADDG